MRKKQILRNTVLLTGSSLLMNLLAMLFQAWLVGRIGAVGIGLYQLVLSVSALAATFAISGVRFAATRLVAEELGAGRSAGVPAAMRRCLGYAAFFGAAAAAVVWLCAAPIGMRWLGDARTVRSLYFCAFSMPCISLSAALSGYFTACGRILRPTLIHLSELLLGILFSLWFLRAAPPDDLEACCAAVIAARLLADLAALLMMLLAYASDRARYFPLAAAGRRQTQRLLKLALPLASSAYARSGLRTAQQIMIPRALRQCGASADAALAGYGLVHGMALPLLFFPSCLLTAAAELIVPALTQVQVRQDGRRIRCAVRVFLQGSLLYSLLVSALILLLAQPLAQGIYRSAEAGRYIRLLAPLLPVMYLDISIDGCLKGLGQQVWSMGINILDALCALLLICLLLPRYGLTGYLWVLYITEGLNCLLSLARLVTALRSAPEAAAQSSSAPPARTA